MQNKPISSLKFLLIYILVLLVNACVQPVSPGNNLTGSNTTLKQEYSDFRVWLWDSTNTTWNQSVRDREVRDFVYACMRDQYYWNTNVTQTLVPMSLATPEAVLEAARYKAEDKTSYLVKDGMAFQRALATGEMTSFGLSVKFARPGDLRVALVQEGSPAEKAGLRRGMAISKVNGNTIRDFEGVAAFTPTNFPTLQLEYDSLGIPATTTLSPTTFSSKVVLKTQVTNVGGAKVGYLLFTSFTASAKGELDSAFARLAAENITELVLDLRYNGGGFISIAQQLASLIASQLSGKLFNRLALNERYNVFGSQYAFQTLPNSLRLKRLFVIMTGNTASASENIINGLKPHIEVITIGSTSFGKNTGSFSTVYHPKSNYGVFIVNMLSQNSLGQSDFASGFKPTFAETDDVSADFGDSKERCYAAALNYIRTGAFPTLSAKQSAEANSSSQYRLIRDNTFGDLPLLLVSQPPLR